MHLNTEGTGLPNRRSVSLPFLNATRSTNPGAALRRALVLILLGDVVPSFVADPNFVRGIGIRWVLGTTIFILSATVGLMLAPEVGVDPCPVIDTVIFGRRRAQRVLEALVAGIAMGLGEVLLIRTLAWANGSNLDFIGTSLTDAAIIFNLSVFEEVEFRLFLLTILAFIGILLTQWIGSPRRRLAVYVANVMQAVAFGLEHAAQGSSWVLLRGAPPIIEIFATPATWGGLIEGYLYFRFGIEAAVVEHFIYNFLVPPRI